ncbi:helix-turn-helix transcriptional regulator [Komagataeibacter intermedius]|uniref:Uncharacterized protein n=2 Tax=Komagataeibacter intermedius TaxID=66229 RepID=A0A0N1N4H2_9PROT|nr:helix-turn-helix transcriptional regulator [Komagataeibacter intermedius]KPH88305.1 hypothetical protein GLUCOINTEAF2_0201720 [Komagataeibacter intermedius AF2]MCF3635646.1 helix-turn-helix transcriptional regulator [Komagataeibacter intermedius]GAN87715.1 hypothetical protein Gain_0077_055 [Komagataeibacter intermedius TF2]GBQ75560.1 hypothetical protein AA0521_2698 [Komagataeibacter intermedius NRIC 0521]
MEYAHKPAQSAQTSPTPRPPRPPRLDWAAIAPAIAQLRRQGCSNRETARRLGLNIKTLEAHLRRHRLRNALPMDRPDQVRRTCLNCDTAFVADGRFLRLCPDCRAMFS